MTLELGENGLPLPGRELDAWIWVHVLGNDVIKWEPDVECPYCNQPMYLTDRRAWCGNCREWRYSQYQEYSTTHAFFQVMEAKQEWHWGFKEGYGKLRVILSSLGKVLLIPLVNIEVSLADYSDREHAYAHAVCCCVWKVMGS